MLSVSNNIDSIKEEVLYEVAKLTFQDQLDDKAEALPFELIPGPQANFRCCIYKEREIIRQRIRLARGKSSSIQKDESIVQVLTSACEGCPITRFVVTDNCQKCVGKRCQAACHFNAISMLRDRAHIDSTLCKECGKCAQACPYNAIADLVRPCKRSCPVGAISMDDDNIVVIDQEKCISCGACINNCPFGAISDRSFMVDVIQAMKDPKKKVYAMLAPAWEGQFGDQVSVGSMTEALIELGFDGMFEVALGADYTAESEAREWSEAYDNGDKKTTSCCPAFVNMIQKHYPQLTDHVSTTISPMAATAKLIKAMHPGATCVFIGPCIAKKGEVLDSLSLEAADSALTLEELYAMFRAKEIDPKNYDGNIQQSTIYGKKFCVSGGVTASVLQVLKEKNVNANISVKICNGAAECKKALTLLKAGKLPEYFMEGMVCEGGCSYGPGSILTGRVADKNREKLFATADQRNIHENLEHYNTYEFSMHR